MILERNFLSCVNMHMLKSLKYKFCIWTCTFNNIKLLNY